MDILEEEVKAKKDGIAFAVLTVAEGKGTSPFKIGKKMLLLENGRTFGTIGGGETEKQALEDAQAAINDGQSVFKRYIHTTVNEEPGLGCSFEASLLIEVVKPDLQLVVCGAGHVGNAVLRLAKLLGFRTTLIDSRPPEQIREKIEIADRFIHCEEFESGIIDGKIPAGAYYVCCAPAHTQDKSALKGVLQTSFAYVGMLGNAKKANDICGQLEGEGIDRQLLAKLRCPVGLDICDMSPEEVALSILAEILMVKNGRTGKPRMENPQMGDLRRG